MTEHFNELDLVDNIREHSATVRHCEKVRLTDKNKRIKNGLNIEYAYQLECDLRDGV